MSAPFLPMMVLAILLAAAAPLTGVRSRTWVPRRTIRVDHLQVEVHDAHVVEDRVVDVVWRAAVSVTNRTRRPRLVPTFAERATVSAAHRIYLAEVYLDDECAELNPGAVALAWVEFVIPAGARPTSATLVHLRGVKRPASRRFRGLAPIPAT